MSSIVPFSEILPLGAFGQPSDISDRQEEAIIAAALLAKDARDRLAEDRIDELNEALLKARDDVVSEIRDLAERTDLSNRQTVRRAQLVALQERIDEIIAELDAEMQSGVSGETGVVAVSTKLGIDDGIMQLAAYGVPAWLELSAVEKGNVIAAVFDSIRDTDVEFLANYHLQLLGSVTDQLSADIKRTILNGIVEGKSVDDIVRDLGTVIKDEEAFRRAGKTVFKTAQHRSRLITRTEVIRAHSEGRKTFYADVGVVKVEWVTALDERVCPVCAPLNGQVFDLGKAPGPPVHPACRCTLIAYLPRDRFGEIKTPEEVIFD